VALPALIAAKLALYSAMREQSVSNVELARRLGVTETVVRRLVHPDHRSKIERVEEALAVLGKHLVVEAA
jgi:antitoxin HicB